MILGFILELFAIDILQVDRRLYNYTIVFVRFFIKENT